MKCSVCDENDVTPLEDGTIPDCDVCIHAVYQSQLEYPVLTDDDLDKLLGDFWELDSPMEPLGWIEESGYDLYDTEFD